MAVAYSLRAPATGGNSGAIRRHGPAVVPGLIATAIMLLWAAHDGGYDADTWYWGALALLSLLVVTVVLQGGGLSQVSRPLRLSIVAFAAYVAFSYLSITWARYPGDALTGSNRALLYLVLFALFALLPWTVEGALAALLAFALGVGVIAVTILVRLARVDHLGTLIFAGRITPPTGYFNSSVALFTMCALVGICLATHRRLPGLLRGLLLAGATASLQLAIAGQSRGWLFTLPVVVVLTLLVASDRLRLVAAAVLPVAGAVIPIHRLLAIYNSDSGSALSSAARQAGHSGLLLCAAVFLLGTALAWADRLLSPGDITTQTRRALGGTLSLIAVLIVLVGFSAATHGDPLGFVKRQWNGFTHPPAGAGVGSHFATVGSGRYDIWRVSLKAFASHPLGGLGQDNFVSFYLPRRRTGEEPQWTHSLEMRLLAHTGIVGVLLFAISLGLALTAALRARLRVREPGSVRLVCGAALLPVLVWLLHGSVDWFWEVPALTGPALGFLALAGALRERPTLVAHPAEAGAIPSPEKTPLEARARPRRATATFWRRAPAWAAGIIVLGASVLVLAFSYLSVREMSIGVDLQFSDPEAALRALHRAGQLNGLSADPGRVGGTIALRTSQYALARSLFTQATDRDPGSWYSWLGQGLASSALGQTRSANVAFHRAAAINSRQPAVTRALARVRSPHPLTAQQAFSLLLVEG